MTRPTIVLGQIRNRFRDNQTSVAKFTVLFPLSLALLGALLVYLFFYTVANSSRSDQRPFPQILAEAPVHTNRAELRKLMPLIGECTRCVWKEVPHNTSHKFGIVYLNPHQCQVLRQRYRWTKSGQHYPFVTCRFTWDELDKLAPFTLYENLQFTGDLLPSEGYAYLDFDRGLLYFEVFY